jgi:hypothetical protein
MGLTIHYMLSVKEDISLGVVRELVKRAAQYARKIGCAQVGELLRAEEEENHEPLFFYIGKAKVRGGLTERQSGMAFPRCGWLVHVLPGAGCESAAFGLCQYPRRLLSCGHYVPTGFKGGWRFQSFCKTQYAGEHGRENFLKCHLRVVSLLDFWRSLGVRVKVNDEGDYWETRSVEKLQRELGDYDRLVAAMGGMFKDGCDRAGGGLSVESPIFDYKSFERLEHEGQREFGARIARFQKRLSSEGTGLTLASKTANS